MMEIACYPQDNDNVPRSVTDECQLQPSAMVPLQEFSQLLQSKSRNWQPGSPWRRLIHGVPSQLRLRRRQQSNDVYEPLMVSLGPYHHEKPELRHTGEFKYICLDWFALGDETRKCFFYNKILNEIVEIRSCYAEASIVEKFDDRALALMMLLDACFIINFMHNKLGTRRSNIRDWWSYHGMAAATRFVVRDILVLENQIPFQVIKLLMSLEHKGEEEALEFIGRFLSCICATNENQGRCYYREYAEPPIHILEACWRVVAGGSNVSQSVNQQGSDIRWPREFLTNRVKEIEHTFHSVTDLKAKGIHLNPSSSYSLKDIAFKSGAFYAQLQLPVRYVSELTQVFISNMIAFEISPSPNPRETIVLSYTIFMKSLIESPEDVKELQRKRILFNRFADHEQVVHLFKEIDTFGLMNLDIFLDVKQSIEKHCSNKAKTWVADLIHTRFRSPWTAIALLAATFLLCLAFLQTWFSIHSVK